MFRFIVLLSLFGAVAAQTCASTCSHGVCFDNLCACASGAYSDLTNTSLQCQLVAPNTCSYANLSNLVTDNFPTLDTSASKVQNDILHVVVYAPLVNNRLATRLYFGDANNASMYPECAFPGPNWVKTIDTTGNCREIYTADIPWTTAVNCGWTITNPRSNVTVYKNSLYVRHDDQVSTFRGTPVSRDTINTFPIQISFQTVVDVQTSITVFAPINLLAAVTVQTYDPVASEGNVKILTSLQWPFFLQSVTLNGAPSAVTASTSVTNVTCGSTTGNACNQLYSILINPNAACTLSGAYQLDFVIACRGDPSLCPLDSNTNTATVSATINSENFCNGVGIDIGLTGSLAVYQDSGFAAPKTSFLHGQTAYFRASLSASSTVTITSSVFEQIRINDGTNTHFLYNANPTSDGSSMNITVIGSQPAANPAFAFVPNQQIMPVAVDQQLSFTVYAVIRVTYAGGVQRRMIIARQVNPSSASDEFAASILMQNPAAPTPTPFAHPPASTPSSAPSTTTTLIDHVNDSGAAALVASALLLAF